MKKLSTEEFIAKAKEVHGNKYDYSKTIYKNKRNKIIVICPIHGEFEIIAHNHKRGQGCPQCGKECAKNCRKGDYKSFLERANKKFGDKYSYPYINEEYENIKSSITIKCNNCGNIIKRRADYHISTEDGLCKCKEPRKEVKIVKDSNKINRNKIKGLLAYSNNKKMTWNKFIIKAKEKYGDSFSYNKDSFVNGNTRIEMQCNVCGHKFNRTPSSHINPKVFSSCGCCKLNSDPLTWKIFNKETFILKANIIHNGKYSYDNVDYKNTDTLVNVTCPIHGDFEVTPHSHIGMQSGCPKCAQKYNYTTKEFIELCKEVHNNFYSYDKCEYIRAFDDIIVTCPEHGDFTIKAYQHKQGKGCPLCHSSSMEVEIRNFLSNNNIEFEEQKTFEWLKYETNMFLDFYVPQYQIAIECQGEQHFKPIEFFGGKEKFNLHLDRDKKKLELCNEHDITILYFSNLGIKYPYNVFENKDLLLEEIKKYDKDK